MPRYRTKQDHGDFLELIYTTWLTLLHCSAYHYQQHRITVVIAVLTQYESCVNCDSIAYVRGNLYQHTYYAICLVMNTQVIALRGMKDTD